MKNATLLLEEETGKDPPIQRVRGEDLFIKATRSMAGLTSEPSHLSSRAARRLPAFRSPFSFWADISKGRFPKRRNVACSTNTLLHERIENLSGGRHKRGGPHPKLPPHQPQP